jgi:hypothetical protein
MSSPQCDLRNIKFCYRRFWIGHGLLGGSSNYKYTADFVGRASKENSHKTRSRGSRMSLIIFFGMALCIFTVGVIVISVTLNHWRKESKLKKALKKNQKPALSSN